MLSRIMRALSPRAAEAESAVPVAAAEPAASAAALPPDWTAALAALSAAVSAARPAFPAGFQGTKPRRWYDESQNVAALQGAIATLRIEDAGFDAIGCLRAFAETDSQRASPLIALALEYRACGERTLAVEAMAAALSINHWDLYTQNLSAEISAWAEDKPNPNVATEAYLKGRFCTYPFEMLETTPNGDVYVCCPSWLPVPIGNVEQQSAEEIWNSPIAQELRGSILDGSYRYCSKMHCSRISNGWLPTIDSPEAMEWMGKPAGAPLAGPRQVILSHDQSCNLACPSCRKDFILANKEQQESLDRVMDRFVMPVLQGADSVRITGSGDPFASNHFRRVIKAINRDDFPRLSIDLHTNGQLWNERAWVELGLSSLVREAEISIDAASPATYAVIRRGGDFNRLLDNLGFVKKLRESGEIKLLAVSFVVQSGNFHEMPDFVRLGERFGADLIVFNMIRNWGTYSREEFQSHFIGAKTHPDHAAFLDVLRSPVLASPKVAMGNVLGYAAAEAA
jgi:MoaA/NifB/PqqE/SkfB family radical SAM enzyme